MKMTQNIIIFATFLILVLLVPSKAYPGDDNEGNDTGENLFDPEIDVPLPIDEEKPIGEEKPIDEEKPQENAKPAGVNPNLKEGFYKDSCPNAEKIVADTLAEIAKTNPNAVSNIIRLQFHDCFVVGCDSSILLDYAPNGDKVEKMSLFNGQLLKGTDVIDDIKNKLEEQCPGVVSCTDTLAFATNEAMTLAGLPKRAPLGGRRDGQNSLAAVAEDNNLPLPNWDIEKMIDLFKRKGFTIEEMVVLLGAHSVGSAHCDLFMERVYNNIDPLLPKAVADEFRGICTNPGTPQFRNPPVDFDETPKVLDNLFYKNMVEKKKSLLITDSHLITDQRAYPIVEQMAADEALWQKKFIDAMEKMGSMNVLTGNQGEVRKTCRSTN